VFSRRTLPVYGLAAMPILVTILRALFYPERNQAHVDASTVEFAQVFYFFILRFVVFVANALLFVRLFRGEILERSLHYTLLAPVRRDVLVMGKYLGGVVSAVVILMPTTAVTFVLMYVPHLGLGIRTVFTGHIFAQLTQYLLVVALACVGYGALFLLAGLFFRNPMVPAIAFLGWEVLTPFLPPFLKALSVVHFLSSLTPVPPKLGPLAILSQPVPAVTSILGIGGGAVMMLALSWRRARTLEVTYSTE
jgi:ABC-type transport system involved in multi-copper enzyme maturation permease subunit